MPADVRFHPEAERELRAAYLWYLDRDSLVASALQSEVTHTINTISKRPTRWPLIVRDIRRYVFPRFPFSLFYRSRNNLVEVIAVAHHKRKPGYWLDR